MTRYPISIENTGDSFRCGTDQNVLSAMVNLGHRSIPVGLQFDLDSRDVIGGEKHTICDQVIITPISVG